MQDRADWLYYQNLMAPPRRAAGRAHPIAAACLRLVRRWSAPGSSTSPVRC
jgi:hypothetical protein